MNNSVKNITSETPSRIKSSFSIENLLLKPECIKNRVCAQDISNCSKNVVNFNKILDTAEARNTFGTSTIGLVETPDSSSAEDILDTTSEVASEESNSKCFFLCCFLAHKCLTLICQFYIGSNLTA